MKNPLAQLCVDFDRVFARPPAPQPCHHCSTPYAGTSCPTCKEERPAYTALKNQTARERA